MGGIVGLSAAEIRNCTNDQPITGKGTSVGGIVGEQQNAGLVSGCTNTADVTNQADAYGTGGIVGWLRYSGTQTAYPAKNIISVIGNTNRGSVLGGNGVGGIVGVAYNFGVINENKNYAPGSAPRRPSPPESSAIRNSPNPRRVWTARTGSR